MTYHHTQFGKLYLIVVAVALALLLGGIGVFVDGVDEEVGVIMVISAVMMGIVAQCFVALTVSDQGDHLLVNFGPVPLFKKRIPYADIVSVAPSRSTLLEGWGLHLVPGKGWTWNIWGRACVDVHLREGNRVRIGTDDQDGLLEFLCARIGQVDSSARPAPPSRSR